MTRIDAVCGYAGRSAPVSEPLEHADELVALAVLVVGPDADDAVPTRDDGL